MLRYMPFKSRPSTIFEYRYKMVYYDKNPSWKDTYTKTYDLMHKFGKHALTFSFKDEHTERNSSLDEDEQLFNLTSSSPVTKKTTLTYKLSKLDNSLYGPETKNTYGVNYELSDWSDVRLSLEKVNKVQATLDRETTRLRFGKVNPDTNTEMSFELNKNKFLLYDETFLSMKYSLFY